MGIAKGLANFLGPVGQIMGGVGMIGGMMKGDKKPKAAPAKAAEPKATVEDEEEQRRKRLLALNAGGNNGQLTAAGGDTSTPSIGRKTLLGQ